MGAASAFLGVFGGENEEGARNTYAAAGILLAEANGSNQILRYYVYGQGLLAMVTPANPVYCYQRVIDDLWAWSCDRSRRLFAVRS